MSQATSISIVGTSEQSTPIMRALFVLALLSLFSLCGMYRAELYKLFSVDSEWIGIASYNLLRLSLFAAFCSAAVLLFRTGLPASKARPNVHSNPPMHDPLLGLRSLAFLMVLFGHWFGLVCQPEGMGQLVRQNAPLWLLTASPWCGVWIFFTLSGYLMGKGFVFERYDKTLSGFSKFYKNRALRIIPVYFAAVIVAGLLVAPAIFDMTSSRAAADLIAVFTFDNRGLPPIGALWSISTEVQFYLMVPFLYIVLRPLLSNVKRTLCFVAVLAVISPIYKYAILRTLGADAWHQFVYEPTLANMDTFLIGFAAAFMVRAIEYRGFKINHGIAIGIVVTILVWAVLSYWSMHGMLKTASAQRVFKAFGPVTTALLTAMIILIFEASKRSARNPNGIASILWKISTSTGILTYALYVVHEPVILAARRFIEGKISVLDALGYFVLTVPVVWIAAYVLYRAVELPFDRLRNRNRSVTLPALLA